MEKLNVPLKVVFTGPESSGKTTLAEALAQTLQVPLVPEFSRQYLSWLGRPYAYQDIQSIGSGQNAWETWYVQNKAKNMLVCDTDWTVIHVWELFGYGSTVFTAHEKLTPHTHYFLCAPDIPWSPDPLREHPADRDALFTLYHNLLKNLQANYTVLYGNFQQRMEMILSTIEKIR